MPSRTLRRVGRVPRRASSSAIAPTPALPAARPRRSRARAAASRCGRCRARTCGMRGDVVELAGRVLEAEVEQLLLRLAPAGARARSSVELAQLAAAFVIAHASRPARTTKRVLIGSLCIARRIASRAMGSGTPESSNITRPGLHHRDPVLGVALARAHAGLGRLLGDGLVGEDVDPDLPATLDVAGHRDTGGLDLAVGDPARLERLDPVVAERRRACHPWRCRSSGLAASCGDGPCAASACVSVLAPRRGTCGVSWCWRVRRSISSSSARSRSSSGSASFTAAVGLVGDLVGAVAVDLASPRRRDGDDRHRR